MGHKLGVTFTDQIVNSHLHDSFSSATTIHLYVANLLHQWELGYWLIVNLRLVNWLGLRADLSSLFRVINYSVVSVWVLCKKSFVEHLLHWVVQDCSHSKLLLHLIVCWLQLSYFVQLLLDISCLHLYLQLLLLDLLLALPSVCCYLHEVAGVTLAD